MIYCPSCSTPWRGRGRFCGECGSPIDVEAGQEAEANPVPVVDPESPPTFRFGAPPPAPDPTGGYTVPLPAGRPHDEPSAREPIALLQYWPVIVPGIVALISGLLIVVQLLK